MQLPHDLYYIILTVLVSATLLMAKVTITFLSRIIEEMRHMIKECENHIESVDKRLNVVEEIIRRIGK